MRPMSHGHYSKPQADGMSKTTIEWTDFSFNPWRVREWPEGV